MFYSTRLKRGGLFQGPRTQIS